MNPVDAKIIAMLAAFRKGSNFGPDFSDEVTQKFWLTKLDGVSVTELQRSLKKLSGNREFPAVNEILEDMHGSVNANAVTEFEWVWNNLNGYQAPTNLPILTARTVDELGGWFALSRDWQTSQREFYSRQFSKIYKRLATEKANGNVIGGSLLALESTETKKEGLCLPSDRKWNQRLNEKIRREQEIMTENAPRIGFGDFVKSLRGCAHV